MSLVADRTREYLIERIEFLEKQTENLGPTDGVMAFQMKAMAGELRQTLNVLNGGTSIYEQVKSLDHAY